MQYMQFVYANITKFAVRPYISYTSSNIEFYVSPEDEKTEISYGHSNVLDREIQFISNAKLTIDTCMDYTRTLLTVGIDF